VTISNVVFVGNRAVGTNGAGSSPTSYPQPGQGAQGGAIYNGGSLSILACRFWSNSAAGGVGGLNDFLGIRAGDGGSGQGGAIYNTSTLVVVGGTFGANGAFGGAGGWGTNGGSGSEADGGALYSTGPLLLLNCAFGTNTTLGGAGGNGDQSGGDSGGNAQGGAVWSGDSLSMTNCTFTANASVNGAPGGNGPAGNALGGAVWSQGPTVNCSSCSFTRNSCSVSCTWPGGGGPAEGGGLANASGAMNITGSLFVSNTVFGPPGGGGAIYQGSGTLVLSNSVLLGNGAFGGPYAALYYGGTGAGGGLANAGTAFVLNSTFSSNNAEGGIGPFYPNTYGSFGGKGLGGGLSNSGTLSLWGCTFVGNTALGASGNTLGYYSYPGGPAYGGAVCNGGSGSVLAANCTFANNGVSGGPGSAGSFGGGVPGGNSYGGALYTDGLTALTNCTFSGNSAAGGLASGSGQYATDGVGVGGNLAAEGPLQLIDTIVNAGVTNNAYALVPITDLGYNLSSDSSCAFTGPGSLNNTDPKLQPLANNGGPTETMALWSGSPAIDAGISLPGINTDQRGVPRPYGPSPCVGAYEWNGAPIYHSTFNLTSLTHSGGGWTITGVGPTNQPFRLRASSNPVNWVDLSTNNTGPFGFYTLQDASSPLPPTRFYRVVSP